MRLRFLLCIFVVLCLFSSSLRADKLKNVPVTLTQPDGEKVFCFASGDEFFNYLHDKNGYTIIQHDNGYYYYAKKENEKIVPSRYLINSIEPSLTNLKKWVRISSEEYYKRRNDHYSRFKSFKDAPTTGTVNNISVFIRFSDEAEYVDSRSFYDKFFSEEDSISLKNYYYEVSYNRLIVNTFHYPVSPDSINISYQDIHPRSYYRPYNATSRPDGYQNDSQERAREKELLRRAIQFVESEIPNSIDFDANNDGNIDNVSFIVSGSPGAWASLLWPHRSSLSSVNSTINGKRVRDYLFMIENTFNTGTLCHEFFHVLGAPDLYHYEDTGAPESVGDWDIMDNSNDPPQYMCAFMKHKYGDWIPDLPVITESGTYSLKPLQEPDNNIFKIKSPLSSNEYFVVEYRKREGIYEYRIPGSGLLVYRIISNVGNGNADGPPDEVYVYRPGGTITENGQINSAAFGGNRPAINDNTNPSSFLYLNGAGGPGGLDISNITRTPDSVSFEINIIPLYPPSDLRFVLGEGFINLYWRAIHADGFRTFSVYRNGIIINTRTSGNYHDTNITNGETYSYSITANYGGENPGESEHSNTVIVSPLGILNLPYTQDFETESHAWQIKNTLSGFKWGDGTTLDMGNGSGSYFIGANSVAAGANTHTTDYAISPRFNFAQYRDVNISFDYILRKWQNFDKLRLIYKLNGNPPWYLIEDLTKTTNWNWNVWKNHTVKLPAEAYASNVQLAFFYDDSDVLAYGAGFDNVSITEGTTGINNVILSPDIKIFPNPSSGLINLIYKSNSAETLRTEILSIKGQKLYDNIIIKETGTLLHEIDLKRFYRGIYFIRITAESVIHTQKIIIQ